MTWTKEEIQFLKNNYSSLTTEELVKHFKRDRKAISAKARYIGLSNKRLLTIEEKEFIKKHYSTASWNFLLEGLNKKKSAIIKIANDMGIIREAVPFSFWTEEEKMYFKENYLVMTYKDMANTLNRSLISVNSKSYKLRKKDNLANKCEHVFYTEKEDVYIKENYQYKTLREIGHFLRRSRKTIEYRLYELGLKMPIKNSLLEIQFENFLKSENISYNSQEKIWKYRVDFIIDNFAIETNGTFWHCDSRIYVKGPKYQIQKDNIRRDKKKHEYLKKQGYNVIIVWEKDWNDYSDIVKKQVRAVLSGNGQDYNSAKSVKGEIPNTEVTEQNKITSVP